MQFIWRGLATALFVVFLLTTGGCRNRPETYTAGVETGQDTAQSGDTEKESGRPDIPEETAAPAGENGTGTKTQESAGYVYVCGFVANPGVYEVYEGMRLFEAIEQAGGFLPGADREWLNLAQKVSDGQRIYVCSAEETKELAAAQRIGDMTGAGGGSDAGARATGTEKVNLNTADKETLMTLPGIGEVKADAIIQYRTEHGAFASAEEIQNISGIKDAVYAKIRDRITV